MADRCEDLDLEAAQTSDTSPLLMDQQGAARQQEHVVNIGPDTDAAGVDRDTLFRSASSPSVAQEGASTGTELGVVCGGGILNWSAGD